MSDSKENSPTKTAAEGPTFTEKEERVLKVAWGCLKSGPPEVDLAKLQAAAGFNTLKTAANTWGVIKKKLAAMTPTAEGGEVPKAAPTKTPAKKRAGKKSADVSDEEEAGSAKKKRKTPVKKGKAAAAVVKAEEDAEEEEEA